MLNKESSRKKSVRNEVWTNTGKREEKKASIGYNESRKEG